MTTSQQQAPRRQWNVRLPDTLWNQAETRRLQAGLSRDEWTRRVIQWALDTTTPAHTTHKPTG